MRRTALGLLMNPQSSAAMPRWRYSDCAEHGMSMNESDSTMDFENIRLSAMPYPLSIKSSFHPVACQSFIASSTSPTMAASGDATCVAMLVAEMERKMRAQSATVPNASTITQDSFSLS